MSAARKKQEIPRVADMELLRKAKIGSDQLREKIVHSIIDNPKTAQKAAFLITLWINGSHKVDRSKRKRK